MELTIVFSGQVFQFKPRPLYAGIRYHDDVGVSLWRRIMSGRVGRATFTVI